MMIKILYIFCMKVFKRLKIIKIIYRHQYITQLLKLTFCMPQEENIFQNRPEVLFFYKKIRIFSKIVSTILFSFYCENRVILFYAYLEKRVTKNLVSFNIFKKKSIKQKGHVRQI